MLIKYQLVKNTLYKLLIILFITIIFYLSIFNYNLLYNNIFIALDLWLYKVFPSLLIFYLISTLLITTKTINYVTLLFYPLKYILKFNTSNAFNLFILSVFLGNPSTTSYINDYYENNLITLRDAKVLSKSASFINPLFVFTVLENKQLATLVYLAHLLSNIIVAIILTRSNKDSNLCNTVKIANKSNISFHTQMSKFPSIILNIALNMVLSYIVISFTDYIALISNLSYFSYINYFIEVSRSVYILKNSYIYIYFIPFILSFNGLCIHMQVRMQLKLITYNNYLCHRLLSSMIATFIYIVLSMIII